MPELYQPTYYALYYSHAEHIGQALRGVWRHQRTDGGRAMRRDLAAQARWLRQAGVPRCAFRMGVLDVKAREHLTRELNA